MSRILAIDYGTKRVGIAVTDTLQIIATGLTTVHSKDILTYLKLYLEKEIVERIVIGYPISLQNTATEMTKQVDQFKKQLQKQFPLVQIELFDERYTSVIAHQTLLMSGVSKKARADKNTIDMISATILLQNYLSLLQYKK